jgi:hypothetical protein
MLVQTGAEERRPKGVPAGGRVMCSSNMGESKDG